MAKVGKVCWEGGREGVCGKGEGREGRKEGGREGVCGKVEGRETLLTCSFSHTCTNT